MLFNSPEFFLFFVVVYSLYLLFPFPWQNKLLLVASYVFYGWWDWRFLSLILISTIVAYFCALKISESSGLRSKKKFLALSLCVDLGILFFFKYFNFFAASLASIFSGLGFADPQPFLKVVLPVGISFYTFQNLSYVIDVYRKDVEPTKRFFDFALYVSFFPQLVAGPIERAKRLLPQMLSPRKVTLNHFYEGSFLVFWGLFEKIFIADNLAKIVNPVFSAGASPDGGQVLIAVYAFSFQIFCDFDGYSNIARGLGKCMGFDIMMNFNLPYWARNPREFWQRWHISLSSWLRDYLYIPLGGNRCSSARNLGNLAVVMLLGGLWHGAAWTFVIWGAYHGVLLILYRVLPPRHFLIRIDGPKVISFLQAIIFFHFVALGWLMFRAQSPGQIGWMFNALLSQFHWDHQLGYQTLKLFGIILPLLIFQIGQRKTNDMLFLFRQHWIAQTAVYAVMSYLMLSWGVMKAEEFIYFQF